MRPPAAFRCCSTARSGRTCRRSPARSAASSSRGCAPEAARAWLAKAKVEKYTSLTRTDRADLERILDEVRTTGFSIVDQELEVGLRSIGVPIRNKGGAVVAGLSVSIIEGQFTRDAMIERYLRPLLDAAERDHLDAPDLTPRSPRPPPHPVFNERPVSMSAQRHKPLILMWLDEAPLYRKAAADAGLDEHFEFITVPAKERPGDDVLQRAEGLLAWRLPAGIIPSMKSLRWIQAMAAGVEDWLARDDLPTSIALTCARGVHSEQMPDNILASIYYVAKPFEQARQLQERRAWERLMPIPLAGQTLGIIGLGTIGADLAKKASVLGLRVIGVKNRPEPVPLGRGGLYARATRRGAQAIGFRCRAAAGHAGDGERDRCGRAGADEEDRVAL